MSIAAAHKIAELERRVAALEALVAELKAKEQPETPQVDQDKDRKRARR